MKNTIKSILQTVFVFAVGGMLIVRSEAATQGVKNGLELCMTTVIPSLLPFMTVCTYILKSDVIYPLEQKVEKLSQMIFSLSGRGATVFLMSIIGGFPVGAKLIADSIKDGALTLNQGKRMLLFCVNPGPAFIINVVGVSMLNSKSAGLILFFSHLMSSFVMGILTRIFAEKADAEIKRRSEHERNDILTQSITESAFALITMCAWIMLFSAIINFVDLSSLQKGTKQWLNMVMEVTNGCSISVKNFPLPITALVLGWSGLSVHSQVLPYMSVIGLKYKYFAVARILSGALSMGISSALFSVFPCQVSAFSNITEITPHAVSISVPATMGMLFLSALVILDLAPKRKV